MSDKVIKYTDKNTNRDFVFTVEYDYSTDRGAEFHASSGGHNVQGKGHSDDDVIEALDDHFFIKDHFQVIHVS